MDQITQTTTLKEQLYEYIDRGWTVIAFWEVDKNGVCTCDKKAKCENPGKHPRQSFETGGITRDKDKIDMWMTNKYYLASNYGVKCGEESGIIAFDIDPRHGGKRDSFDFPPTLEYRTGGGGWRLIYKYPKFDIEADNKFGEGVELIVNGFIVVPPSNHTSGSAYEWIDNTSIAEIPQEFIALGNKYHNGSSDGYTHFDLPEAILEGDRDATLYRFACSLRAKSLDYDEILATLIVTNKKRCKPPLDNEIVVEKAKSACKHPKGYDPNFNNHNNITYANASGSPLDIVIPEDMEITFTDWGNAERFARIYSGKIGYCEKLRPNWLIWNGKYWESGSEAKVTEKAGKVVQEIIREASEKNPSNKTEKTEMNELLSSARKLQSAQGIKNMLYVAKGKMLVEMEDLNQDKHITNFNNGTLNMDTLELTPHNPKQLITRVIEYDYKPEATCPRWMEFVNFFTDNDEDTAKWIQKALGWSLAGRGDARIVPFLHGNGHNGKSTFKEVLLDIFGEYSYVMPIEVLLKRKYTTDSEAPTAYKRNMVGKRLVFTTEMPEDRTINSETLKDASGADKTSARGLHELKALEFRSTWIIWIYGNHKPKITDDSEGMWDRVKLIPFSKPIPTEKQRPMEDIIPWFLEEAEGIISWMVDGYRLAVLEGLKASETIAQASQEYRKEEDILQQFIDEKMVVTPKAQIVKDDFRAHFSDWIRHNGGGEIPKPKSLTIKMREIGFPLGGDGNSCYVGIGLKAPVQTTFEDKPYWNQG